MLQQQIDIESYTGVKKQRGRPKTGKAKTGAQRVAAYRARKRKQGIVEKQISAEKQNIDKLSELLEHYSMDEIITFAYQNIQQAKD